MTDEFIERRVITGMIVSTEFLKTIRPLWNVRYLESSSAKTLAGWCVGYFDKYKKAPNRNIQDVYMSQLRAGLQEEKAEAIERILDGLSDEYESNSLNIPYLIDETRIYFKERKLKGHAEDIKDALADSVSEAEQIASSYNVLIEESNTTIEPFTDIDATRRAFEDAPTPILTYPTKIGVLGSFWNDQFIRDGFLALLGPEKRGKSYMLLDIAIRGYRAGNNVAVFQAGDMSEGQEVRRLGIYLSKKSDMEKYCGPLLLPILDCKFNQIDECDRAERECTFGVFEKEEEITYLTLLDAFENNLEYKACRNCRKVSYNGRPWFSYRPKVIPLQWKESYQRFEAFNKRYKGRFKLSTHPNESLTVAEINTLLDTWENSDGFVPDIIVIDYADLLLPDLDLLKYDKREQINKIWQRLRRLSQVRHCLVVSATQASASSYDKKSLRLTDFSEDKRKYAHVTAMYGLNQTDEEKKIGIMRISEMVLREGDFDRGRAVKVLQRLQIGRPILDSYW